MAGHNIVVVGFSAGGIEPLVQMASGLPRDLPASLFVVHHFPAQSVSVLPAILNRSGPLKAAAAENEEPIVSGRIYVAPPDHHLLIRNGTVRLTGGPREHGHRPAVDPLFRSAARSHGSRVIGVLLSGSLDDGTAGLHAIKAAGGLAMVQDPASCAYPGMPESAIEFVAVDHVVTPEELSTTLVRLVNQEAPAPAGRVPAAEEIDPAEPEPAVAGTAALRQGRPVGRPSTFSCPDCGGVLWESEQGELLHFRCHVGHAFSEESLLAKQSDELEGALWTALRALEEKADLARRLADRVRRRGGALRSVQRLEATASDAEHGSNLIRASLLEGPVRETIQTPAEPGVVLEPLGKGKPG
jgi:two-component system chemotaxis response regulator CheB